MAGAQARAVVAVKIFVKKNMVAQMLIRLKLLVIAENRPPAVRIFQKDTMTSGRESSLAHFPKIQHIRRNRSEIRP